MSTDTLQNWLTFVEAHPHDFTIQYPPRREYFMEHFRRDPTPVREWFKNLDPLLFYLHVPFCEAKCYYCNFAVDVSRDERIHREYVDALLRELDSHADWLANLPMGGVDIGGGTPTRLSTGELERLLAGIRPLISNVSHPFPLSIETTPHIAAEEPEKLMALRAAGVARVSLGVQSFNAQTLALVNRGCQIERTEVAMTNLRAAGFMRTNLDIIFGLPNQSLADWKCDLEQIIALAPDSVTTYDCLYRGRDRALTKRTANFPSPENYGTMYDFAHATLNAAGWHAPYGSVNFSRHKGETGTSAYFEGRLLDGLPYLGLGNYATSLRGNLWSFNTQNVKDYTTRLSAGASPVEFFYQLPIAEAQAKYVLYSFNFGFVDELRFKKRFGVELSATYTKELDLALDAGWLERRGNHWQVAPGQFRRMHLIRSLFYPEPARKWLMALK